MQYRSLGKSGLKVSAIGLGTNAFGKRADKETSIRIVHEALDSGINMLDTANIYAGTQSESIIGDALAGRRHEAVLATKAGLPMGQGANDRGSSRFHLQRELEGSLRRLKTDYVDLYQIHTFDPGTPLEETLRTLDDFVSAGKVRYIGASNYAAWELMKALGISERLGLDRFVCTQASYSLADRTPESELIPLCLDQGVGLIPYFPLAGGILTGKYASAGEAAPEGSRAETDPSFRRFLGGRADELGRQTAALADELGVQPAVLAIAWLLARPAVATVIAGATKPEQLQANLAADALRLSEDALGQLDRISDGFRGGDPFAVYRLP
ncbi:aldo/keto reductase [Cohnella sp. JJ-181]|uniref:aldo/keto reductase n=1 Tax=Cohnella rhizoplanae TaxID=2974897 RepID=UPI0022FF6FD5|nr:aldo/keto reductase [Cohnella sp. JJ-181]CAI6053796.1 1-deoxyxylulose-5-phosphate synthase YajO [Cohnella sp. JJ-181]